MSSLNFEIKVQCKGKAVGTLGWLNSLLSRGELVIKNTKSGTPGMFLQVKREVPAGEKEFDNYFICRMSNGTEDPINYRTKTVGNVELFYIKAQGNDYEPGLCDYPLTPAAHETAEDFIQQACDNFIKWWENN